MTAKAATLAERCILLAEAEVGAVEIPRGSNRGPRVDEYQRATWLKPEDWGPWCASFVCWVIREAMWGGPKIYTFKRPRTAGAFDFERWSLEQDDSTRTRRNPGRDIQRGDIVIFSFSHIGWATGSPDKKGTFPTIEGNTNPAGGREGYAVLRKRRRITEVQTRIRFTV